MIYFPIDVFIPDAFCVITYLDQRVNLNHTLIFILKCHGKAAYVRSFSRSDLFPNPM